MYNCDHIIVYPLVIMIFLLACQISLHGWKGGHILDSDQNMPYPWPCVVGPNPAFLCKLHSSLLSSSEHRWGGGEGVEPSLGHSWSLHESRYIFRFHVRQLRARQFKYGLKNLPINKRRIVLRRRWTSGTSYHFLQTSTVYVILPGFTVKIEFCMQQLLPVSW